MDEEKMQRQMEFIVEQQAQVAVSHAQSAARIAQLEELLVQFARATRERFEGADRRAQEESRKAAKRSEELDRKIAALIDAQIRGEDRTAEIDKQAKERAAEIDKQVKERAAEIDKQVKERAAEIDRRAAERAADFDRRLAALLDSQRQTEEAVRKLTATVDRHIAEGHNGRARSES